MTLPHCAETPLRNRKGTIRFLRKNSPQKFFELLLGCVFVVERVFFARKRAALLAGKQAMFEMLIACKRATFDFVA